MTAARIVTSDAAGIELAINALKRGAAIGIPTETVYGLASGAQKIAVMRVPCEGLGEAINDRLQRAAAPR